MTEEQKAAVTWAERAVDSGFAWARHVKILLEMIDNKNEEGLCRKEKDQEDASSL